VSSIDQIRQDYREAVASAIEGSDNLGAWERVRKSLADAIFSAWLIAAAKTAEDIPECELTKMLYAKEGCGAGKEGAGGFQPGNTCAGDGDGQAESGEPSHQTSSPEFKSWFGDSKVVDDSGEPIVVYHGTNQDFDEFNIDRSKTERNKHFQGDGIFFSEDEYTADQYSDSQINQFYDKDLVIDELIKSGKPNTAEFIKWQTELGFAKAWKLAEEKHGTWSDIDIALEKEGVTDSNDISDIAEWIAGSEEEKSSDFGEFLYLPDSIKEVAKRLGVSKYTPKPQTLAVYLKAENILETDNQEEAKNAQLNGYDAVKYTGPDRVGDSPEWIIFDPTQIKSATGNKGDFDPDDPKITHKRTFAKDTFDEMFEMFDLEPTLQAGVNEAALADLEGRVPMLRSAVDRMEAYADELAEELIVAERAGILPFMESTSKGVQAALKNAFWVSDVDHSVVVNIQKLLGDAIRGVMPDDQLQLPEFIKEANLIKAMNLTDARLETIYRTNISTAANEGVMAILRDPEARDLFPLVMITEIDDNRSRPHHAAMDGYITTPGEIDRLKLRPPNGYNCRGSLIKISWDEANDEGWLDDYGNVDMISVRRHNSPEQEGLVAAGIYPDEGFKRGGFFNEV